MDCLPRLELKEIVLKTPRVKSRQKNGMSLYKQPANGLEYWSIYLPISILKIFRGIYSDLWDVDKNRILEKWRLARTALLN